MNLIDLRIISKALEDRQCDCMNCENYRLDAKEIIKKALNKLLKDPKSKD